MKPLNILIGCLLFREYTGSEMYVFELSKGLKKSGHNVSIVSSHIGGPLTKEASNLGIKVYSIDTPPLNEKFDIIHSQHQPIVQKLLELYPKTKMISTIHSEVIPIENPIIHPNIKKYIAIRQEIKDYILNNFFPILESHVEIIYNPIDETRFNHVGIEDKGYILFVGTIDYLRKNAIMDLIKYSKEIGKELWIVGKNHSNYMNEILSNNHVKYFQETKEVEMFVKGCSFTAGILMGRTTIEGWMCGKPGLMYLVNQNGFILDKKISEVPSDYEKFGASSVIKKIENLYYEIKK